MSGKKIAARDLSPKFYRERIAINDFRSIDYDHGDIVIVTDGDDNGGMPNAGQIRRVLDENNLRLHALMLGVNNDSLRRVCDVYQIVESDMTVHDPVRRKA